MATIVDLTRLPIPDFEHNLNTDDPRVVNELLHEYHKEHHDSDVEIVQSYTRSNDRDNAAPPAEFPGERSIIRFPAPDPEVDLTPLLLLPADLVKSPLPVSPARMIHMLRKYGMVMGPGKEISLLTTLPQRVY